MPHLAPLCPSLFCFPCCHNISAAKSRGNWLQLRPCADPAHSSCIPQIPCAIRPSQPTGYLATLLVKVKHPYSDIQITVSVYITDFPCLWQKLFRTVYHCLLLWKLPFYILDYDYIITGGCRLGKVTNCSRFRGKKYINMVEKLSLHLGLSYRMQVLQLLSGDPGRNHGYLAGKWFWKVLN